MADLLRTGTYDIRLSRGLLAGLEVVKGEYFSIVG